ncbi:hypothetical protein F4779DRAFT_575625 [Xylariaceae sp. FL0662B]|nr:hypothetical protein F4779DRAFT_575625 [Xylariaceae sp. FL0662B]
MCPIRIIDRCTKCPLPRIPSSMLEKTAASLEPCGLQRVVPGATKSFRTTRHLHTAFWQHGAAEVELTNAWQALMHGTFDLAIDSASEENRRPTLCASAFLLDFLYPTGAIALIRRLASISSGRPDGLRYGQPFTTLTPCLYTPSMPRQQARHSRSKPVVVEGTRKLSSKGSTNQPNTTHTGEVRGEDANLNDASADVTSASYVEFHERPEANEGQQEYLKADDSHIAMLADLLTNDNPEDADRVWYHYRALDEPSQAIYMSQVLILLSKSGRLTDSWKISELFHKLKPSQWNNATFVAGVIAEINLQNPRQALDIFVEGLEHSDLDVSSLVDALDLLLENALRSSSAFLGDIWDHYPQMAARWDFDGITSQLNHVASVPGLAEKAFEFQAHGLGLSREGGNATVSQAAHDTLQRILVRKALVSCTDAQAIPLLNITQDPMAFEEFLRPAVSKGRGKLATEVYRVYRELPDNVPSPNTMHETFRAYNTIDVPLSTKLAGIELLWGDWYKFHTTPHRRAFQRYLRFYASLGYKERVHALWADFIKLGRDDHGKTILEGDDTFVYLLQVHSARGEIEEVKRIFNDISDKFGIQPNTTCWNVLLNAHARVGDYDGAISTFLRLLAAVKPDSFSYGAIMQMAGNRGDLGFTVDLYRRARSTGIVINDVILGALVDAYCQNEQFQEAQDVCVRAANRGIVSTRIWNKLLRYHARRRDLAGINNILNLMADKDIPYNHLTYKQLLIGLSLCQQSQHALQLLAVALKDEVFKVTPEHFYIVMGALLRTGEPGPVQRLHQLMQDHGFPSSSASLFRLTQAVLQWNKLPWRQRQRFSPREWLGNALRSFYQIYGLDDQEKLSSLPSGNPQGNQSSELLRLGSEQFYFSSIIYMFTQLKDFGSAGELIQLYRYVFQGRQDTRSVLPISILSSVMIADLHEKRYDRVEATWHLLFETAKKEARSADYNEDLPHTPKISAKFRNILSDSLKVMQEMLFSRGDAVGIRSLVEDVRAEGFELDSKNWNYYIQIMVQLKQYKEAFSTCEKILMPNWTGWFVVRSKENVRNQLPLDVRRKGSSRRYLRPVATTLYHLAQGYMELDQLGPWSGEAAKILQEINNECVQVVRAIKSMIRVHSELEYEIFGENEPVNYMSDQAEYATEAGEEENVAEVEQEEDRLG